MTLNLGGLLGYPCSPFRLLIVLILTIILFHLLAGIRHLLMDLGFAESVKAARNTAFVVFIFSIVLFILVGIWLW